jgi:hypothetical protein
MEYVWQLRSWFRGGALSDERTGLSFVCAVGPCQRSLSRVLVSWDLRPYSTVSDLRLPFSSPPTTRRVMVEVFDPVSTRVRSNCTTSPYYTALARTTQKTSPVLRVLLLPEKQCFHRAVP